MTVVYPLAVQIDYTELKYSLRSIEKYLKKPYEVIIVGNVIPDWINNVTQIELPDVRGRKQWSIRRKILAALEYTKEMLFMNDDVYLLQPAKTFPYYYNGTLKNYSESGSKSLYDQLLKMGKPVKNYDGHYPLIYDQRFKEASKNFSGDCIIKSMYCNYLEIEGIERPDCKLLTAKKPGYIREFIKDKPCFNTGVHSLKSTLPILEELFSEPSKYEI